MKTTVDIPDDLYDQARELAAARGQQIATLITEGLQKLVVAQLPRPGAKSRRNGKAYLPPKATRWLSQWRALSQRHPAKGKPTPSAAEIVSRMRR